jgi:predicted aminopeptidase
MPRYLAQATHGQLELITRARPIEEVLRDPEVSPRTRILLAEIPAMKAFAASHGLSVGGNYTRFVELDRSAAVWFVGAADPVAFTARKWCFPIVGCFAGLGWFDEEDALVHRRELEAQGYDAFARPASAYSTGGWFPDPVVSTMLSGGDDAFFDLANLILHESVHATVLVPDQPFFNESFAQYVADTLTDDWIKGKFGAGSHEHVTWHVERAIAKPRSARLAAAYRALDELYRSTRPRAQKLVEKAAIIDRLVADLHLIRRPNNASLLEFRVYQGGHSDHARAHRACGSMKQLVTVARTLRRGDFRRPLQDDLTEVSAELGRRCHHAAERISSAR